MAAERDSLLEALKTLIGVADETLGSASKRDYAKTRELAARRASVESVGTDYRRELRRTSTAPSKMYRCIEDLDRGLKACLTEMDSVQASPNQEIILSLRHARALATEFATAAEREGLSRG
jgi:hypothetical protein